MKLFQQLLLAPAALGLLAPVAATAAEVNIDDVANYAGTPVSQMRAAKATQFSDVVPGDWAYTALLNLSESYGCVDSAYTQNLKSGQSLTRYEAAALVNSCLQGGVADASNSDVLRLKNEFGTEMAILKGRVDGLEYKVEELSAGQFSSATKIDNSVSFNTGYVKDEKEAVASDHDSKLHMQYFWETNLYTSFNGKDQLYTSIATGNGSGPFEDSPYGTHLVNSASDANAVKIDKLWYTSTIGPEDNIRYWVGPKIEATNMLASSPSIYQPVLKQFANGGSASTYGSIMGTGFGLAWTQSKDSSSDARFEVSSNYSVADDGGSDATKGILSENQSKWLTKVGYGSQRWQVSLGMAKNMCENTVEDATPCAAWNTDYSTSTALSSSDTGGKTAYALRANWQPESSGIMPSVQAGYEWATIDDNGVNSTATALGSVQATRSWMIGFTWDDVFIDDNTFGVAFGQPEHATDFVDGGTGDYTNNDPANKAFAWEAYYDYKVNDGITITPAVFAYSNRKDGSTLLNDGIGGLIQTTFKF